MSDHDASPFWSSPIHRMIVIFADFSDVPATTSAATNVMRDHFIRTAANGGKNNLQDFYHEMSHGRLTVEVDFTNRWHRLARSVADYRGDSDTLKENFKATLQLLRDAITTAQPDVDYSKYDSVAVVVPKDSTGICNYTRGTRFGAGAKTHLNAATTSGVVINRAMLVCEAGSEQLRFEVLHEFGHVLGLPDMYTLTPERLQYAGGWDIMTSRARFPCAVNQSVRGFCGWSHMKLGFISGDEIAVVRPGESISIDSLIPVHVQPLGGAKKLIRIDNPVAFTYLLLEGRKNIGYDSILPGLGVLLSEVDETLGDGQGTVRVIAASGESFDTSMTGALFKAPKQAAPPDPTCDTSPGTSSWSRTYRKPFVSHTGVHQVRTWNVGFSITSVQGHRYAVQVDSGHVVVSPHH